MNRSRERERSRGQQTHQIQSGFQMDRVQQDNHPSQHSWQPGFDGSLSYPNMHNHYREPTEALSTSNWNQEGPEPAPSSSGLNEQSRANTAFFGYGQDGLQSTRRPYTGYAHQDRLLWDEHAQHRTTVSNTVEAQPDWTLPSRTNFARNPMVSADSVASPYLHPVPSNQPVDVFNVQGRDNDLEMSRLPEPTTAYRPTSNGGYPYDLSGLSPAFVAQGSENLDNNFEPFMEDIGDFQTNTDQEPWSAYEPNRIPQSTQQEFASPETYPNGTLYTNPSTFENGNSESSYQNGDESSTRISSNDPSGDVMCESMLTERPGHSNLPVPPVTAPCSSVSTQTHMWPNFHVRCATPPLYLQENAIDTSNLEIGLDERSQSLLSPVIEYSDTVSCSSDASSPAGPPEIFCDTNGCVAVFSGIYRKGNLARHKRLKHKGPVVYECEDLLCDRVFKRQDARVKHYRRWHPQLASDYHPRYDSRRANRERFPDILSSRSG